MKLHKIFHLKFQQYRIGYVIIFFPKYQGKKEGGKNKLSGKIILEIETDESHATKP